MKNQYFGDIGDYGKYGLLRFLAGRGYRIAVNWYLTADDGRRDGRFTDYLERGAWRSCDPDLFDFLRKTVIDDGRREVSALEEQGMIPLARYYRRPLPEKRPLREAWHREALAFCAGADLVFLDPDVGLCPGTGPRTDGKHVLRTELADYCQAGLDVVYYCHRGRRPAKEWTQYEMLPLADCPDAQMAGVAFHRGSQRCYLFVLHRERAQALEEALADFVETGWRDLFTREDFGRPCVPGESVIQCPAENRDGRR